MKLLTVILQDGLGKGVCVGGAGEQEEEEEGCEWGKTLQLQGPGL